MYSLNRLFLLSFLPLLLIFAPVSSLAQSNFAILRAELPEFRDVSVWKGRAGLTRFSPDGKYLAISAKSADIAIYDTESGVLKSKIDGPGFRAFSFSPDGKFAIAQNNFDLSLQIFDVDTGNAVRQIRGLGKISNMSRLFGGSGIINQLNGVFPVAILEMGDILVSKDWKNILINKNDKEFSIVDFETGQLKYDLKHENFNSGWETTKLAFAIIGVTAGVPGGSLLLGSASNSQFSANGKYLLIANGNKTPTLWNVENGTLIAKFDAGERVFYTRFSPDESLVATSDYDGITKIWDTASGELMSTIGSKKERGIVAGWNNDSTKVLINGLGKGDLRAHDSKTGSLVYGFEKSQPAGTILSDDSRLLVTIPRKNKLVLFQVWDTDSGKMLASVPREKKQKGLISIKWNPTDEMIATTDGIKKEVKIWDTQGNLLQTLNKSTMPMQFSFDGKYLATGGVAGPKVDTGYLWELPAPRTDERISKLQHSEKIFFERQ